MVSGECCSTYSMGIYRLHYVSLHAKHNDLHWKDDDMGPGIVFVLNIV